MSEKNNGGPAFPVNEQRFEGGDINLYAAEGMTLRDYFAAKFMPVVWDKSYPLNDYDCALIAYRMADAMLRARDA